MPAPPPSSGLTSQEAAQRLTIYGYNEIAAKKVSFLVKYGKRFISPISLMLLTASGLSFFSHKIFDAYFILLLLLLNQIITAWQEHKADTAIQKLNHRLETKLQVLRDHLWQAISTRELVPGDLVKVSVGSVIPADGKVTEAYKFELNESAVTGESLPKEKNSGDQVVSGAYVISGWALIEVVATGSRTYFGKTLLSVEKINKQSLLEKDILTISRFLTLVSFAALLLLTIVLLLHQAPILEILTLDLSLVIAGVPISLPTVMTLIIELGVVELSKKQVLVRRLSSLQDLANVNLLLTDKTGTLTTNSITIHSVTPFGKTNITTVLSLAKLACQEDPNSIISQAVFRKSHHLHISKDEASILHFTAADSDRKHSTTAVKMKGKTFALEFGAPQVVAKLCKLTNNQRHQFEQEINNLARRGYRTVALAKNTKLKSRHKAQLLGILAISDRLRPEAASVANYLKHNGIDMTMVTGDNRAIAQEIASQLRFGKHTIVAKSELEAIGLKKLKAEVFTTTAAFAEILPKDKYELVVAAKKYFTVASTGDGINDLPALKAANISIAVANAVDILKATADIVLLSNGISVIKDALFESKKIFARLYSYSVYRISESLRLIITILILGVWYHTYPLTPIQLILLAILNDIPIISLAFDRVRVSLKIQRDKLKHRFALSTLFGLVGVFNSLLLFLILTQYAHLSWEYIQTIYFLKLTIGGHLLVYVARTKKIWFSYLPSLPVIITTSITQLIATILAATGLFMPAKISLLWIGLTWLWCLLWMQLSELSKQLFYKKLNSR
ncbi:HAD-IC family P-type ATPase [Candidatus Beckwithbacteria bacterium]|nr:HAD-IC family P-type ATPase [Candidatus Beckwithbacteria bacterium]